MKAILPNKHIIRSYLIPILTITPCKSKNQLNATHKCKQNGNLSLYALACMQTNNRNRKHYATLPPCLNKALLFKGRIVRQGKRNKT